MDGWAVWSTCCELWAVGGIADMKLIHAVWMFLAVLLMGAILCYAAIPVQIQPTWTYPSGVPEVAGFRLYRGAIPICKVDDPAARTMTCSDTLGYGLFPYTMTAYTADGVESAASAPFGLKVLPPAPGLTKVDKR